MAFETEGKDNWTAEEARVGRAVRRMAHFAAFDANRWMFECERATFIEMAFETGFLVFERLIYQRRTRCQPPCRREGAMWIMTIAASHESFVNAMLEWHREVGAHVSMTPVTQLRLGLRQQKFGRRRFVYRMALRAYHVIQRVR